MRAEAINHLTLHYIRLSEVRVVRGLMPLVRRPVGGKRLVDVFK
jgi:hypothetical protein